MTPFKYCYKITSFASCDVVLLIISQVLLLDKEELRNMSDFVRSAGVGRADIVSGKS